MNQFSLLLFCFFITGIRSNNTLCVEHMSYNTTSDQFEFGFTFDGTFTLAQAVSITPKFQFVPYDLPVTTDNPCVTFWSEDSVDIQILQPPGQFFTNKECNDPTASENISVYTLVPFGNLTLCGCDLYNDAELAFSFVNYLGGCFNLYLEYLYFNPVAPDDIIVPDTKGQSIMYAVCIFVGMFIAAVLLYPLMKNPNIADDIVWQTGKEFANQLLTASCQVVDLTLDWLVFVDLVLGTETDTYVFAYSSILGLGTIISIASLITKLQFVRKLASDPENTFDGFRLTMHLIGALELFLEDVPFIFLKLILLDRTEGDILVLTISILVQGLLLGNRCSAVFEDREEIKAKVFAPESPKPSSPPKRTPNKTTPKKAKKQTFNSPSKPPTPIKDPKTPSLTSMISVDSTLDDYFGDTCPGYKGNDDKAPRLSETASHVKSIELT